MYNARAGESKIIQHVFTFANSIVISFNYGLSLSRTKLIVHRQNKRFCLILIRFLTVPLHIRMFYVIKFKTILPFNTEAFELHVKKIYHYVMY